MIQQWGDASLPISYTYDATYGDRTGQSTYRDAPYTDSVSWPSVGTADTTTMAYDAATGYIWKKTDAKGEYVAMDYNVRGQMSRRTLARGVYTDYAYDSDTGEVTLQDYSDSTTDVSSTYTRLGQAKEVDDATGTWDFVYDSTKPWRLSATGLLIYYGTRTMTMQYESSGLVGRYLGFKLGSTAGSSADLQQTYAYATNGRLDTLKTQRDNNNVTYDRTFDYSLFDQCALCQRLHHHRRPPLQRDPRLRRPPRPPRVHRQ